MRRWAGAVRDGSWLTRERIGGYGAILLAFELACFAFCVAGTHGWIVTLPAPVSSDFVSFYAAGALADAGTPALAYDRVAHGLAEQAATEPGIAYNFFYYPPIYLLVCAVLARLPYLLAFVAFQAATVLPAVILARHIVRPAPLGSILAFPALFWAVGTGQNAGLTAALLAGGLLLLERRPAIAGVLLGALCYKPHLAPLVPLALLAGRQWRALAGAGASAASLFAVSVVAFGWPSWVAWLHAAWGAGAVYAVGDTSVDLAGITSPFGLALALGAGAPVAAAVQGLTMVLLGAVVFRCWRGPTRPALRNAVLLAAIPLAAPIGMFYDLLLTGLSLAWLIQDGRHHGFPPWQRSAMFPLFVLPLLSGNTGFSTQIGIPPLAAALGLCLAIRQARAAARGRTAAASLCGNRPALA